MEGLPESLLYEIVKRIERTEDRNSISLVCKRLYAIDAEHRWFLRVGCGLHPATQALSTLCARFTNVSKLEIVYSGWMASLGNQLDNQGLVVLSTQCPSLKELNLSFCSFVTDTGLAHLASCRNLVSFKLNFAQAVTSNGILSLVVGCKKLSALHLVRCMRVSSAEWLDYAGRSGRLENLSIKNCRGIGEDDLMKLGAGWKKLKYLEFEVDAHYRHPRAYEHSPVPILKGGQIRCEELKELTLINCILLPGRGLSSLLGKCKALEKLHLDMCVGVKDTDMVALSKTSGNLRSISLRLPSQFLAPVIMNSPLRLTDECLKALARGCSMLEEVELSLFNAEFPSFSCFSQSGILALIQSCPIRVLALNSASFFNDAGMEALCSAKFLERLELVKCQEVSDDGIQLITHFPCLNSVKLCRCLGVTDIGLQPLVDARKLYSLAVEDCPQISEKGVRGVARSVSYKQDMSWLY